MMTTLELQSVAEGMGLEPGRVNGNRFSKAEISVYIMC
jgi:hypothetical protein